MALFLCRVEKNHMSQGVENRESEISNWCAFGAQRMHLPFKIQKYPQHCWEIHDQLWEAVSGTTSEKRGVPSRIGGEIILEMLWKPQMPWIIGFGASQPYSRREFQETLWERFRGPLQSLSGTSSGKCQPYWGYGPKITQRWTGKLSHPL